MKTLKTIVKKKLQLKKEAISALNNENMSAIKGGDYISRTRGTIYHCPSYPNYCPENREV